MIQQFHMGQFHSYPFVRDHKFCIRDVTWGHLQKYSKKILQHARALIWMKHYQSTPTRWIIISQLLVRCLKLQSLLKSSSPVLFSLVFCEFCDHSEIIFSAKAHIKKPCNPATQKNVDEWMVDPICRNYHYYFQRLHMLSCHAWRLSPLNLLYLFGSCLIGIHLWD
jgi:hypothetical protein